MYFVYSIVKGRHGGSSNMLFTHAFGTQKVCIPTKSQQLQLTIKNRPFNINNAI